jgi:uncharacterized protein (TIGR00297 family)
MVFGTGDRILTDHDAACMPGDILLDGEGLRALGALLGLAALVGTGEGLRRRGVSAATTRRLVHAGVALFVAATPLLFERPLPVYGLAALFTVVNAAARARRWWSGIHEARPESWGTVALPLSVLPALAATWSISPERLLPLHAAYLVLALSDPAASWAGERWQPKPPNQTTTAVGSLAFAGVAFILLTGVLVGAGRWALPTGLGAAVGATLASTAAEAASRRGWDNFFVVIAVLLVLVPLQEGHVGLSPLAGALVLGAAFAVGAYWAGALDRRGAGTAGLFAGSLVALGGGAWVGPGVVFFGVSSLLTGVGRRASARGGPSERRTQAQVMANGGVAWSALAAVALGLAVPEHGYLAFVGALAAAAADTWATELGRLSPWRPWALRHARRVPAGTSGAVSAVGTGAALAGAGSVVGTALWLQGPLGSPSLEAGGALLGAGLAGMMADSVAGAFLQARYRVVASGLLVEEPPSADAQLVRGWARIGNNAVNLIGTAAGALTALLWAGLAG